MGRGDSSWQDRNHHIGKSIGGKKASTGKISPVRKIVGAIETYDSSKGSKAVSTTTQSTTSKKRKSSLEVNISGAGGTGRNIV